MGVTVTSAYITLATQNESAWQVVQAQYTSQLLAAAQRIIDFNKKC